MPNWCDNILTIYDHKDYDIGRVAGKLGPALNVKEEVFEFQEINPVPEELIRAEEKDGDEFGCITEDLNLIFEQQELNKDWKDNYDVDHPAYPWKNHYPKDFLETVFIPKEYLERKYGSTTAYDYRCEHWGTKWVGCNLKVNIKKSFIELSFQTAWSPPEIIIQTIIGWFPKNSFTFIAFEPGVGFLSKVEGSEWSGTQTHTVNLDNTSISEEDYNLLKEADPDYAHEWWERSKDGSYQFKEDDIPYDD